MKWLNRNFLIKLLPNVYRNEYVYGQPNHLVGQTISCMCCTNMDAHPYEYVDEFAAKRLLKSFDRIKYIDVVFLPCEICFSKKKKMGKNENSFEKNNFCIKEGIFFNLICTFKLLLSTKPRLHTLQRNGFNPVWRLTCKSNAPCVLNAFEQRWQENGRSPVWICTNKLII